MEAIFLEILPDITSAFCHIAGNLHFFTAIFTSKRHYRFNEFTEIVTAAELFDLQIVGVICPREALLKQLGDLLNCFVQVSDAMTRKRKKRPSKRHRMLALHINKHYMYYIHLINIINRSDEEENRFLIEIRLSKQSLSRGTPIATQRDVLRVVESRHPEWRSRKQRRDVKEENSDAQSMRRA